MISIIDKATSVEFAAVTFNSSVASITTLFPASISNDDPAGIGALVTSSTSSLASSLLPARFAVLDDNVTSCCGLTRSCVAKNNTQDDDVVVVAEATVYITSSEVTFCFCYNFECVCHILILTRLPER